MSSKSLKYSLPDQCRTIGHYLFSFTNVLFLCLILQADACRRSPERACRANQKTLLGAVEMYYYDTSRKLVVRGKRELNLLLEDNYIHSIPLCAHNGKYRTDRHGNVWCTQHGSVLSANQWRGDDPIPNVVINPPPQLSKFDIYLPKSLIALARFLKAMSPPEMIFQRKASRRSSVSESQIFDLFGFLSLFIFLFVTLLYLSLSFLWYEYLRETTEF